MKHSSFIVCYPICLIWLLIMRICELFFITDAGNGFYRDEYSWFTAVAVISVLLFAGVISMIGVSDAPSSPSGRPSVLTGIAALLTSAAMICSFFTENASGAAVIGVLREIFVLISAACFALYGVSLIADRKLPDWVALGFIPVWIIEILMLFIRNNDVSGTPEQIYNTLTVGVCIFAALKISSHIAGVDGEKNQKPMFVSGILASGMCMLCTLPRYIVAVTAGTSALHPFALDDPMYLFFGFFAACFVLECCREKKPELSQNET